MLIKVELLVSKVSWRFSKGMELTLSPVVKYLINVLWSVLFKENTESLQQGEL